MQIVSCVKYTDEVARGDIPALNMQILQPWIAQIQERGFEFTVHKETGLVRHVPNIHGHVFVDLWNDVHCSIGLAIDTNEPVLECRTSPVEEHVNCAMEDILNPTGP